MKQNFHTGQILKTKTLMSQKQKQKSKSFYIKNKNTNATGAVVNFLLICLT
jgi:hypothetical protein